MNKKLYVLKIIGYIFVYVILCVIAINTVLGYINFNRIKENKKPLFILQTKIYEREYDTLTSYRFGLYKIIMIKRQESITFTPKLWFIKDF